MVLTVFLEANLRIGSYKLVPYAHDGFTKITELGKVRKKHMKA